MPVASSQVAGTRFAVGTPASRYAVVGLSGLIFAVPAALITIHVVPSDLGFLGRHMATHILLMNLAAPLMAIVLTSLWSLRAASPAELVSATALQVVLLWCWHSPSGVYVAHASFTIHAIAQASLFLAALVFWLAVLTQVNGARWRAVAALLLTGKLFCLLGALLTFAPQPLFTKTLSGHFHGTSMTSELADQQLAGLMMLAACPATYVLAGVVIAARWLDELLARAR